MTDFDSLLPPRVVAPRLPDRGGPAALLAAASRRRGRHTTVAGAAACVSVAITGLTALGAPALHSLRAEPTARTITTTAAPAKPKPSLAGVVRTPPRREQARRPAQVAAGTPLPSATPTAAPRRTRPRAVAEAVDRYTPVVRALVPDLTAEECELRTSGGQPQPTCLRIVAPPSVESGRPADLAIERCARVRDASVTFAHDEEAFMTIETANDGEHWGSDLRPTGAGRHTERIPAGHCLRYTFTWNGLADSGDPLPPGRYSLRADVPSEEGAMISGGVLGSITVTERRIR